MRAIIVDIDYSEKACQDLTTSVMLINSTGQSTHFWKTSLSEVDYASTLGRFWVCEK